MPSAGSGSNAGASSGPGAGAGRPSSILPNKRATPKGTPLAPSVEKAYYRKCIQLKRRLNEVEAANEEARIRRGRLDRAIMKMRLERAFLLEQLQRRMEVTGQIEGSEGSGSEGVGTPPPDRPHRDKRRSNHHTSRPASNSDPNVLSTVPAAHVSRRQAGDPPPLVTGPDGGLIRANAIDQLTNHYIWVPPEHLNAQRAPVSRPLPESPYGPVSSAPTGVPGSSSAPLGGETDRESGVVGEAMSAGPRISEGANGERRVEPEAGGGFTAVNS